MKKIAIKIANLFMRLIYFFMKLRKTKHQVTFISRQGNKNSLDFDLVQKKLKEQDPNVIIISLNKRFKEKDSILKKFLYCFHILKQMHYIATSKVVVLETYCMPISMLKHKKDLKVIQMWHALGSLKKFGYSIIDKKDGSSLYKVASMHKNYDYILASSKVSSLNFSKAFNQSIDKFKIIPLPRVDYLMDKKIEKERKENILKTYPSLKNKKIVVYAPTFRKEENKEKIKELVNEFKDSDMSLVLKLHPLTQIDISDVLMDKKYPTIDWLFLADYVITDYSAIVYEASILEKPLYFYTYDYDTYVSGRDFYLDYKKEMPGVISSDSKKIKKAILNNKKEVEKQKLFNQKYIEYKGNCTLDLVNLILDKENIC